MTGIPTHLHELVDQLDRVIADLPPTGYANVAATWTTEGGQLLTLGLSRTERSADDEDDES